LCMELPCAAQFASFGNSIQPIWWNSNMIIVLSNSTLTSSNFRVKLSTSNCCKLMLERWKKEDSNKRSNLLCILVAQTLTKEPFFKVHSQN
jgi:hypothetical protein